MNIRAAMLAVAPGAPQEAVDALLAVAPLCPALSSNARLAALVAQCAHESGGFKRLDENLRYSAKRLCQVWPSRFHNEEEAAPFAYNPEGLANAVYGGRMGNVHPGDGWRFRGRGYLQLTGRENYRSFGLEDTPEQASEPETAWRVAIEFMDTRSRGGKTAFEWADEGHVENATRIINGGTHGLADRLQLTQAALTAIV